MIFEPTNNPPPEQLPPLVLAYIGDAVYELYIRSRLIEAGLTRVKNIHQRAVELVQASFQAQFLQEIESQLTEEEQMMMRRGRNAKSGHVPKSAEMIEYRYSTGLETLIGYLYLKGEHKRLCELMSRVPISLP
ncbi:MAG: ribonuclease III [Firmicutes bacterium]|nr:ribonuclease III [Bacillota bacterium]